MIGPVRSAIKQLGETVRWLDFCMQKFFPEQRAEFLAIGFVRMVTIAANGDQSTDEDRAFVSGYTIEQFHKEVESLKRYGGMVDAKIREIRKAKREAKSKETPL